MSELDKCRYDSDPEQTIRELLDRPHQVPHMTNYKQALMISFRLLLVEFLPTRHSTQFTQNSLIWTGILVKVKG